MAGAGGKAAEKRFWTAKRKGVAVALCAVLAVAGVWLWQNRTLDETWYRSSEYANGTAMCRLHVTGSIWYYNESESPYDFKDEGHFSVEGDTYILSSYSREEIIARFKVSSDGKRLVPEQGNKLYYFKYPLFRSEADALENIQVMKK